MRTGVTIIACATILDCLTGAFGFLNAWLPEPPVAGVSMETKFVIGIVAFCVLVLQTMRIAVGFVGMALRSPWIGEKLGRMTIRALTRSRPGLLREIAVRWLWQQITGKRLKSVSTIAKRARGIEVARKVRVPVVVPVDYPENVVPMRRAA